MEDESNVYGEEYKQCKDCIHKNECSPCPCDSCEQNIPTNFEEEPRCEFGCKTNDDCPSIDSNFAGGCEQCAYNKRLN